MPERIFGRAREEGEARAFLTEASDASLALVFAGEPGIGKTVLWEGAVARARDVGHDVLAARPAEAERDLPYAGLVDLFIDVSLDDLPEVPEPQRVSLEAALLRDEAPAEPLAVSLAVRSVLHALSEVKPLLVAIDDLQWLDQASERALAFALRRLEDRPVSLLATIRTGQEPGPLLEPSPVGADRLRLVSVNRLEQADLARLLQDRLGMVLAPPSMTRLAELVGGNPFHALELARSLPADARLSLGELPTGSPALTDLLSRRLAGLSTDAAGLVAAAAALARPTTGLLQRIGGGLDEAVAAGILQLAQGQARFTHPLLAAVALQRLSPDERHALHLRLADLLDDAVERARHRSLGTSGSDAEVADELEAAAALALDRAAPDSAAELAERAAAITPPADGEAAARRALLSAKHHITAGDGPAARAILERLSRELPAGMARAQALILLAEADEDLGQAVAHLDRARRDTADQPGLRAEAHLSLATLHMLTAELGRSESHCQAAMRLARCADDDLLHALAVSDLAFTRFHAGRGLQRELAEEALAVVYEHRDRRTTDHAERLSQAPIDFAIQLLYADELDDSRRLLEDERAHAERRGDLFAMTNALLHLAELELRVGNWQEADLHADELFELGVQMRLTNLEPAARYARALVDAHIGRAESARAQAIQGRDLAKAGGDSLFQQANDWALGLLELSLASDAEAHKALSASAETYVRMGLAEGPPILTDAAEAAVAAGDLDAAKRYLDGAERPARQTGRTSILAAVARGRALLETQQGDLGVGLELTDQALAHHAHLAEPFQEARTLLVRGGILRRIGQRSLARETLGEARASFDRLGAEIWARRAEEEIKRIGGRRASGDELTETEQRVAALVAEGRTNREVAAALFVTPKTVEANLSRIYRKLGVRSRTELARRFQSGHELESID
jgi:DNA-binding CsgD family transcriptional regulator